MRSVGWSLFGFALVVAAVALGALTTPAVDHGLATVAVEHHVGFTRRQWVDLAIAALFFIAAAAAAGALVVTRLRASASASARAAAGGAPAPVGSATPAPAHSSAGAAPASAAPAAALAPEILVTSDALVHSDS